MLQLQDDYVNVKTLCTLSLSIKCDIYNNVLLVRLYFTKVKLGSPPTEFNVQIDTGSDILWVTCGSCSTCPRSSGLGVS